MSSAVLQVALEQASYGPFCNIMAITYISAIVEGKDVRMTCFRVSWPTSSPMYTTTHTARLKEELLYHPGGFA